MNQNSSYVVPDYPQLNLNKENKNQIMMNNTPNVKNLNKQQEQKNILFFSNYCNHSKKLLSELNKINVLEKVELICIDNRYIKDNVTYVRKNINESYPLPPMVNTVPTMCLLPNYEILTGGKIYNYFKPISTNIESQREQINLEPNPFCMEKETIGSFGVSSDNFSFFDSTDDELSASGNGGMRQTYNYSTLDSQYNDGQIHTPNEELKQPKMNMTLEQLQQQRQMEI